MYSLGTHHVALSDIRQDSRSLEVFLSETPQGYPVFRTSFEGCEYEVSFAEARLEVGLSPFYTKHEVTPQERQSPSKVVVDETTNVLCVCWVCRVCGCSYQWSADEVTWLNETQAHMPCGHAWRCLERKMG
jgi:hypothetical protein